MQLMAVGDEGFLCLRISYAQTSLQMWPTP